MEKKIFTHIIKIIFLIIQYLINMVLLDTHAFMHLSIQL
jgi:hypothetical protein